MSDNIPITMKPNPPKLIMIKLIPTKHSQTNLFQHVYDKTNNVTKNNIDLCIHKHCSKNRIVNNLNYERVVIRLILP